MRPRPLSIENPEHDRYVSLVPDGDIKDILTNQRNENIPFLSSVSEELAKKSICSRKMDFKRSNWAYDRFRTCDGVSHACHCAK